MAGTECCNEEFIGRFKSYMKYIWATLSDWNGTAPIRSMNFKCPDQVIYADASGTVGFGAIETSSKQYTHGVWTEEDIDESFRVKATSSTLLEIHAICLAIKTLARINSHIQVYSDSMTAVLVLQKRYCRSSDFIQGLIITMDRWCYQHSITLAFNHVYREDSNIQIVDSLSKGMVVVLTSINV